MNAFVDGFKMGWEFWGGLLGFLASFGLAVGLVLLPFYILFLLKAADKGEGK